MAKRDGGKPSHELRGAKYIFRNPETPEPVRQRLYSVWGSALDYKGTAQASLIENWGLDAAAAQEARQRGGEAEKYDPALQEFIDWLLRRFRQKHPELGRPPKLPELLEPLEGFDAWNPMDLNDPDDPELMAMFPRFDDVFVGSKLNKKGNLTTYLCWKNRRGADDEIRLDSLYAYLDRALANVK